MNERDNSQTPNKQETSQEALPYADVEIHDLDPEITAQKVYLSAETVGLVTGLGELPDTNSQPVYDDEGRVVLVGEVTILGQDGKTSTMREKMDTILAADARIREERMNERQRQATVGKSMAGAAFKSEQVSFEPVAPPELPPHPDDELGQMVSRRDVLDMLADEQAPTSDNTGMIEVPREFVPESSTARTDQVDHNKNNRNVPYEGIPTSAKYAPGSIYDPDRAEKDALARYMQNTSEQRNSQE